MDLKFPTYISDGARDLISKLLRHNPTDRLSLKSVIDHPWVRSNSRRVLPPICQTEKSWAPPACLPHTEECFICPSQQTLACMFCFHHHELQTAIILIHFTMEKHAHSFFYCTAKCNYLSVVAVWKYFVVFIAIFFSVAFKKWVALFWLLYLDGVEYTLK